MMPTWLNGERMPGAVGVRSCGRTAETERFGVSAIRSRHGALEPGSGRRLARRSIAALSFCTANSVAGTTEAVTRLPPEPGPSGNREWPICTVMSSGSSPNSRATVLAITVRVPVPISCTAVLATMRPFLMASSTVEPGCQK